MPQGIPDLFQIDATNTSAIVYFAPVHGANKYFISYGRTKESEEYGVEFETSHSSGVISYTINALAPNTTYYFKVRSGNGCMPGEWSDSMEIKTTQSVANGTSYFKNFAARVYSIVPKKIQNAGSSNILGAKSKKNSCEYVVKQGDTLWDIASEKMGAGSKYENIMDDNNLTSTLLRIGQVIKIRC